MSNKRPTAGVHVGSASIVMIFAVLCLTVFASLSLVTANYERKLAEKSAAAVQQYYAADWQCETIYEQIYDSLQSGVEAARLQVPGVQVEQQNEIIYLTYAVEIDQQQQLAVKLAVLPEGAIRTEQWNVVAQPWDYAEDIHVWDGETES